jgi:N-acetylneuraminate synthase
LKNTMKNTMKNLDCESILIGERPIGPGHPPFVIAEMSGNHNQSLERALAIVDAAARSGAHGLKIQTYTPDTMTIDIDEREFHISDSGSLWAGKSLYKLYQEASTPWEWHVPIFERARQHGMVPFSTPFDETSIDFLMGLDVPCFKIASFENADITLIRRVASTGKPLIISTGMATLAELDETVRTARDAGCKDLILLKCTSTYPATPENTNVRTVPHMRQLFGCEVGLSDHTMGVGAAIAAVALGATVIEKHFTLNRQDGGVDSTFSMEPAEMAQLVTECLRAWQALGRVGYGATDAELRSIQFRRSLYIVKELKAGDVLTRENVKAIRPGLGMPTKYLDVVIGRRVKVDVPRGTGLAWGLLE